MHRMRRLADRLRHRRVRVNRSNQLFDGGFEPERGGRFRDQFGRSQPNHVDAEQLVVLFLRHDLDEALGLARHLRAAEDAEGKHADAHVVENEKTWTYVSNSVKELMPVRVTIPGRNGRDSEMWAIEGKLLSGGPVSETDAIKADRELDDVPARVKHMDELGTDIQVLFPTFFLRPISDKPETDLALCRSRLAMRCRFRPNTVK